jgi:YegS/Rv2252/BmrU family lipid kinase
MKHIFLINSFTTKEKTSEVENRIKEYCKNEKIDYVIEINGPNYDTEDIVKKYQKDKNIIIAVGGDGVINRVLNEIVKTNNILSFIPFGTGNDFYKSVLKELNDGENTIDIAKINNRYFINTACFGIDADVANNKNIVKTKLIPKKQKYNISLIYNFFNYKCRYFEVMIDEQKFNDYYTTIAICNGSFYGSGYNIAPSSTLKDGLLDIYLAPKMNKFSMINLILKMKKGKHEKSKRINYLKSQKIKIKSPQSFKCNIDGEELYDNIFDIEIIPNGLTVYYNKKMIDYIK